jgi:anti-sigma-K factor RskA
VIDDHERIEELLAGYVLRSLTGTDADEADRLLSDHLPGCATCRTSLEDLQATAADLGLAADPIEPPETLLPRLHRELEPQAPRRRPMQIFAVAAGVVAVVGLAGLTVSQSIRANNASVRADSLANAVQLAQRDDARMVEVGPVQEITAPGVEVLYVTGHDVPTPPAGEEYRVWLVDDGEPRYVGEFLPDDDGHVILEIAYDPATDDDLWISLEPADAPTDAPTNDGWWSADEAA